MLVVLRFAEGHDFSGRNERVHLVDLDQDVFGVHFPERSQALATYSASAERFRDITARARVDVFLASHTNHDKTLDRINALRFRNPGDRHPFVDSEAVQRHLTVVGECAQAQLGWFLESQQ